ncbi:MAG TPA: metallophosphoesterase, partial [Chitinophaga sp.]
MRGFKFAMSVLGIMAGLGAARAQAPADSVLQRIILIGDAGELKNGHHPVVDALKGMVNFSNPRNTVVYLGDNVYPLGLPDESSPSFESARAILDYQVSLVKGTQSQAIFIPGNHDWKKSRPDGWNIIKNQQQYIDSLGLANVSFYPKDGCPGPVPVPIGDNILLLLFDSEWWLFPYDKPGEASDCDCKSKNEVLAVVADIARRNPRKIIVFASHHPFRSYGPHGGNYTIKQHIFPLTDLNPRLYIPLPVIGSIYPLARGVFGTLEDLPNPTYQAMVQGIEKALSDHGPVIFVSGHDHTLQYIEDKKNYYIVSGAGAKENRVRKGPGSEFASNGNGFAMLEYMQDSTVRVRYFTVDNLQSPVFVKNLFKYTGQGGREALPPPPPLTKPVITMPIDVQYNQVSKAHRFWFGENYRTTWAAPVDFPVVHLQDLGLQPLKRGGGMQTYSLRLEDKKGDEWVLRSLKKYPASAIPEALRQTFAKDIVQDNMSSAMPYAPVAVARLADAAGVPHANP